MIFLAYCASCKEKVTVLPILNSTDLKLVLEKNAEVRVMHTTSKGDHVWSLDNQDKENLRNTIAKGLA